MLQLWTFIFGVSFVVGFVTALLWWAILGAGAVAAGVVTGLVAFAIVVAFIWYEAARLG